MRFIKTVWRGDAGLATTYWIWGTLVGLLLGAAGLLVGETGSAFLAILYLAFIVIYFIWVSVGVWRSAGKYQGKRIWSTLARIGVVIGSARSLLELGPLMIANLS